MPILAALRRLSSAQRGAMFGLDARIALGVFGIMTTMIGFFAMSKIHQARYAAAIHELEAINDAMTEYQADIGVFVPFSINGGSDGIRDFQALTDKNAVMPRLRRHWNGPYLREMNRDHPRFGEYSISIGQINAREACAYGKPCYAWIVLTEVPLKVWQTINHYFDASAVPEDEASEHQLGRLQGSSNTDDMVDLYFRTTEHKGMRR